MEVVEHGDEQLDPDLAEAGVVLDGVGDGGESRGGSEGVDATIGGAKGEEVNGVGLDPKRR